MGAFRRFKRSRRGGVSMISAFAIPALAIAVGATVEVSRVRDFAGQLQDAVDAAALQATKVAAKGGDQAAIDQAAKAMVSTGLDGQTITASPAVTATLTSRSPARVKVEAATDLPLIFGGVLGRMASNVTRAAVAESEAMPVCILLLEPSANAWSAGGGSQVSGTGCAAHVNSGSSSSLQSNGGAGATMKAILTGGTVTGAGGYKPTPTSNQPAMTDPIAPRLTWPSSTGTCTSANTNVSITSAQALSPGSYCGGISVGNKGVATLSPGVYVIKSGDLSVKSGTLKGLSGVTIVLLGSTSIVSITSGGTINVSAPMTGSWRGVAIAIKPQATAMTSNMQGGGQLLFDGIVYLPSQTLHLTGGGDMAVAGNRRILVTRKLETQGNGAIALTGDPTLLSEPSGVRLVE